MAELPLDEGIARFKQNEDRLDKFVNDATGYTASGGQQVDSLRALAEQVAQFYGGIYSTTSAGIAATSSGEYFSVPVADGLNLYLNNTGVAELQVTFPDKAVATYGRFLFTVRDTTFTFSESGNDVILSWSTLRMIGGGAGVWQIDDLPSTTLAAGRALYLDMAADSTPFQVLEGDFTTLAPEFITGRKVLLVANYVSGYLIGEIAESFVRAEQGKTKYARLHFTVGKSTLTVSQPGTILYVAWTGLAFTRYGTGALTAIADLVDENISSGQCLYINAEEFPSPVTVVKDAYTNIQAGILNGSKILLLANNGGNLFGVLAPFVYSKIAQTRADEAYTHSYNTRRIVSGKITSATISGGNITVSISEGRTWKENNGGTSEYKIAPLENQTLAAGEGLIVDFENGTQDAQSRYIPEKLLVAQAAASGWQTATKYVLVGNNSFGSLFGAYTQAPSIAASRAIGVHDGKVAFSTSSTQSLPIYDPQTRTLSWPQLVIVQKDNQGELRQRIKLQAGSIVFPAGKYWVAELDLSQVLYDETPATAVSVGQYYNGGWVGDDENAMPLFAVSDEVSYPVCFPPTVGSTTYPGSAGEVSQYDPAEVVVLQRETEVDIFMKGSNPTSNKYLRYRMQRVTTPAINSDVWRIDEVVEFDRTGEYSFSQIRSICNPGEFETAIKQTGKSDFMGGTAHGDEELFYVRMLIDGTEIELGQTGNFRCRRVEFLQGSDMYEVDTIPAKDNRVAKNYKRWVYEAGELELFQRVEWEDAITLEVSYMTMCTLLRFNGTTQISDKGYRSPLYLEEDIKNTYGVSITVGGTNFVDGETVDITAQDGTGVGLEGVATVVGGAVTSIYVTNYAQGYTMGEAVNITSKTGPGAGAEGNLITGFPQVNSTAAIAKASGPTGYSAEVEILEGWDKPNRNFNFSNSASYNKFYFDFTGSGYVTTIGEVFESRTRYKLDTRN